MEDIYADSVSGGTRGVCMYFVYVYHYSGFRTCRTHRAAQEIELGPKEEFINWCRVRIACEIYKCREIFVIRRSVSPQYFTTSK